MKKGKVRNIHDLGDKLMLVSSDRVSCFDVILKSEIPGKGKILNQISAFWLRNLGIKNHYISSNWIDFPEVFHGKEYHGRSMLVIKAEPIRIECVVRKYINKNRIDSVLADRKDLVFTDNEINNEWKELVEPVFTPAVKNDEGHDENVDFNTLKSLHGEDLSAKLREKSITLMKEGFSQMKEKGIILADTKFEFGMKDGEIILIDEVFTPDSSRFFNEKGQHLDKEYLRKFLKENNWDLKEALPVNVIEEFVRRYEEIEKKILS